MTEHFCSHCQHKIIDGLYWVREKVYGSDRGGSAPVYVYYHAAPFANEISSCYEKYLQQQLLTQFVNRGGDRISPR
jgi:hypothetical protein